MTCCQQRVFFTSPLKPLKGIQRNLRGSKISTSSTNFVFFGPIRKTRWTPWPLIGWNIFLTSLQKPLNQIQTNLTGSKVSTSSTTNFVFFGPIELFNFSTLPLKPLNGIQWNLTESKILTSSSKIVFLGPICLQKWPSWLIRQKGGTWYSRARYMALLASCFVDRCDGIVVAYRCSL